MSVTQMTPFRQAIKAYSTLINLPIEIARSRAILEQQIRALEPPVPVIVPAPAKPIDIYDRMGLRLMLDRSSLVDKAIIDHGWWERPQIEYLLNMLFHLPEFVFLDIGSYWGLYSMIAHRAAAKSVYAFEPDRHNHAQLQAQLFLNDMTSAVTVINKAVSSQAAQLTFWDSRSHPEGNRAGVGIVSAGLTDRPTYPVEAVSIDEHLGLRGELVVIKLDVEGHEHEALRGMKKTVANNKVLMQIEVFDYNQERILPEIEALGLREIHRITPDRYYTNIPAKKGGS